MFDDATLLPPVSLIHERLTRNQRERNRLRILLRLARNAAEEWRCQPHETRHDAPAGTGRERKPPRGFLWPWGGKGGEKGFFHPPGPRHDAPAGTGREGMR